MSCRHEKGSIFYPSLPPQYKCTKCGLMFFDQQPNPVANHDKLTKALDELKEQGRQEERTSLIAQVEGMENPYQSIDMTKEGLAEWALIEGGKRLGFSRAKDDLLTYLKANEKSGKDVSVCPVHDSTHYCRHKIPGYVNSGCHCVCVCSDR